MMAQRDGANVLHIFVDGAPTRQRKEVAPTFRHHTNTAESMQNCVEATSTISTFSIASMYCSKRSNIC